MARRAMANAMADSAWPVIVSMPKIVEYHAGSTDMIQSTAAEADGQAIDDQARTAHHPEAAIVARGGRRSCSSDQRLRKCTKSIQTAK